MEGILRKQLKDFQRSFVAQHGRPPSKSDMAKEPGIQSAYDAWHAIRKVSSSSTQAEASSSKSGTASRVFTTPSRKSRAIAPQPTTATAATPTPTSTRKKNPFATPSSAAAAAAASSSTQTPSRPKQNPPTPSTIVRIFVTPPHPAASTSAGLNDDAQFDYANSPSRLKALIAARSTTGAGAGGSGNLLKNDNFTPRTKARKRLRGEFVPPTPEVSRTLSHSKDVEEGEEEDADDDAPEGMGRPLKRRRDLPNTDKRTLQLRTTSSSLLSSSSGSSSFKRSITAPALMSSRPGASQSSAARARGAFLADLELDYPTPPPSSDSTSTNRAKSEYPGLGMGSLTGQGSRKEDGLGTEARTFRRTSSRAASIFAKGTTSEVESLEKGKGKGTDDVQMAETTHAEDGDGNLSTTNGNKSRPRGPRWTLSQIEISDAESEQSDTPHPSSSSKRPSSKKDSKAKVKSKQSSPGKQTITLAPYLRHGTVRLRLEEDERKRAQKSSPSKRSREEDSMEVDGAKEVASEEEDDDDELLEYSFPLKRPRPPSTFKRTQSDPLPTAAPNSNPIHDFTSQNQHAAHAARVRSRAMIRALLGEMEELDLEREQKRGGDPEKGSEPGKAKNWGQAKEMAGGNKRGKGKGKGKGKSRRSKLGPESEEEVEEVEEGEREKEVKRERRKREMRFERVGRAGVGADEDVEEEEEEEEGAVDADESSMGSGSGSEEEGEGDHRRRELRRRRRGRKVAVRDEDWDSEVESEEYGLGDGEMDEMDVV
ncbi:hypothetical protein A4X13_0g2278 [Tilletia indica]|uniref:Uncharacterized protein n=1 Tax=Tilletia indica TaxID=43049 RepID=A0A177TIF7_9BASI|nr:hypothetical protein A4X13_0g2278 [Tilletia indica]